MDAALLKERELFKKRALQLPTIEKRKAKTSELSRPVKKHKTFSRPKEKSTGLETSNSFDYKASSGSSQYKFAVLAKIVKHMRVRHQQGDDYPLSIDDILDETNQLDVGPRLKNWLSSEALLNNPKVEVVAGDTFKFKPKYNIRDRKGLLRLLRKHDEKGLGGIALEDVEEAVPNVEKVLKMLGDQIIYVSRAGNKKKILFYNDKSYQFTVDDEFQKLWRSVAVDGIDEGKIEDYLGKQGIASMQDLGGKKVVPVQKRKGGGRKGKTFKKHNDHMADILQDYSEGK